MADKKTYFLCIPQNGEYINLVYETEYNRRNGMHLIDLEYQVKEYNAAHGTDINLHRENYWQSNGKYRGKRKYRNTLLDNACVMNKKNMNEWCFDDRKTIDIRMG